MYRQEKTSKLLQIAMQDILRTFSTPEIRLVSVMHVDVNANCGNAKFYISVISDHSGDKIVDELNSMKKQLRYMIGEKVKSKLRKLPEISFYRENFLEKAYEVDRLIEKEVGKIVIE